MKVLHDAKGCTRSDQTTQDAAEFAYVAELLRDRFAFMAWTLRLLVQSDTATPFDHTPQPINESSP